jgi:hypothetical protein
MAHQPPGQRIAGRLPRLLAEEEQDQRGPTEPAGRPRQGKQVKVTADDKIEAAARQRSHQGAQIPAGTVKPGSFMHQPLRKGFRGIPHLPGDGDYFRAPGMNAEGAKQVPIVQLNAPHRAEGVGQEDERTEPVSP